MMRRARPWRQPRKKRRSPAAGCRGREKRSIGWYAVRRRQRRGEDGSVRVAEEVAEKRRRRPVVVLAKAPEEERVRDEASPAFADEGRARERRRQRWQAQEDLAEEIVVVRQRHRRHWRRWRARIGAYPRG